MLKKVMTYFGTESFKSTAVAMPKFRNHIEVLFLLIPFLLFDKTCEVI